VAIQRLAVSPLPQGRKQVALLSIWRRVYIYDDWRDIAKTAGRSEQAQRSLVERSLAYHTLRALKDTDVPPNFILPPSAATDAPLPAELAARYPAYAPEEIEALLADHRDEIAALEALLDDEAVGFEERIKGVMRIVDAGDEIELDGEGDVDM
jgi:nuclear pore complex protein Nup133